MENNCSLNSEKSNQNIYSRSLKRGPLRTREIQKTKITHFPKHIFNVFCFQEQKTVLENSNQIGPK